MNRDKAVKLIISQKRDKTAGIYRDCTSQTSATHRTQVAVARAV
jgi:hypothetical protein